MKRLLALSIVVAIAVAGSAAATPASSDPPAKVLICKQKGQTWSPALVRASRVARLLEKGAFLPGDPHPDAFPNALVFGPNCERQLVPLDAIVLWSAPTACEDASTGEWSFEALMTVGGAGFDSWGEPAVTPGSVVVAASDDAFVGDSVEVSVDEPLYLEGSQIGQTGPSSTLILNPCPPAFGHYRYDADAGEWQLVEIVADFPAEQLLHRYDTTAGAWIEVLAGDDLPNSPADGDVFELTAADVYTDGAGNTVNLPAGIYAFASAGGTWNPLPSPASGDEFPASPAEGDLFDKTPADGDAIVLGSTGDIYVFDSGQAVGSRWIVQPEPTAGPEFPEIVSDGDFFTLTAIDDV